MDNEKVLKKLIKKIIEVITSLEDAKIELERARFMSEKLYEMYSDTNKSDEVKVYEWECCGKIVDIEFNHIVKADNCADAVHDLLKTLLNELRMTEGQKG